MWVTSTPDLDYHVRRTVLPEPGSQHQLEECVADLHTPVMDRDRPLWELHVIEGLEHDRVALYIKTHHAGLDGASAQVFLMSFVDTEPHPRKRRAAPAAEPEAALPVGRGVAFVTNHDLELAQYGGFSLPDDGWPLAHAYTTCRLDHVPLVWMDHREDPVLRAALRLRAVAAATGWETLHARRQLLVWRCKAQRALLVLNAAASPRHIEPSWLAGLPGWHDAITGEDSHAVPARQPGLFVRS
jgi:hypothetical protein